MTGIDLHSSAYLPDRFGRRFSMFAANAFLLYVFIHRFFVALFCLHLPPCQRRCYFDSKCEERVHVLSRQMDDWRRIWLCRSFRKVLLG